MFLELCSLDAAARCVEGKGNSNDVDHAKTESPSEQKSGLVRGRRVKGEGGFNYQDNSQTNLIRHSSEQLHCFLVSPQT